MEVISCNVHLGSYLGEHKSLKFHGETYTMEVTLWNLLNGSYLMELTPWQLPRGTQTVKVT